MDDEFERMLKGALSPSKRDEDHAFVSLVSVAIQLDEQRRSARRAIVRSLLIKLIALAAVAAALLWIGQAPTVRDFAGDSPSTVAAFLVLAFAGLIALISSGNEMPAFSGT